MQYLSQDLILALNPQTGKTRFSDSRMAALINLMPASHLTEAVFRPKERPEARSRIKAIAEGELVGQAVSKAIFTIQAAATLSAINVR
jgi:golgi phosphoprotein 3